MAKRKKNKTNNEYRGLFNKYYKGMPLLEIVMKDISYSVLWVQNFIRNRFKSKSILVYPHYPSRGSTIYKLGKKLSYNITNKPKNSVEIAVYWEYLTSRTEYHYLEEQSKILRIVNLYSRDISKIFIDRIHQNVFGYSTVIDPITYEGKIVKKSDINAKHDGEILRAPISSKENGYIYQLLIDNTYAENQVMDIRVPVVNGLLDFVYIKYRNISERFLNTTNKTIVMQTNSIFDKNEIELLNKYCAELRLDYGELDVLRDNNSKRIYVVDVNNTPQGPPSNTSKKDSDFAIETIALAFKKMFDSNL
jgi:hypothetical protein